jgi:hypothetical protein
MVKDSGKRLTPAFVSLPIVAQPGAAFGPTPPQFQR